jgi:hypothetical protein
MAICLGWTDGLQACRLWQVDRLTCETVLERLVRDGFLYQKVVPDLSDELPRERERLAA